MAIKILFVNPIAREREPPYHIPLGTAQLAAVSEEFGHSIAVGDVNAFRYPIDALRVEFKRDDFDVVAMGGMSSQYKYIKQYLPILRESQPDALIVCGGGCFTTLPREMLRWNSEIDVVCIGESENTWVELLEHVFDRRFGEVRGVAYRDEKSQVIMSEPRPLIGMKDSGHYESLDDLPYPAYHLFPVEEVYFKYSSIPLGPYAINSKRRMSLVSERGCPEQCVYCTHLGHSCYDLSRIYGKDIKGPAVRYQSARYVIDHIKYLRFRFAIDFVSILDENFASNRKRCLEFADLMEEEDLVGLVRFGILGHPRTIDYELMQRLRDVGCDYCSMGAESGSNKILKSLNRTHTVEQTQAAVDAVMKAGVNCIATFMVGTPNETVEDILETVNFWIRNQMEIRPFLITPYPGTRIFEENKERIINQFLTDDEQQLFKLAEKDASPLVVEGVKLARENALEKFVLSLGDAVDLSANISPWDDATLLGLRELMVTKNVDRIKRWAKEKGFLKDAQACAE